MAAINILLLYMNKNSLIIIAVVVALISLNIFLKPYLRKRDVTNIVQTILTDWQKGDIPSVYPFWQDPQNSPPIYGLASYQIKNKIFTEKEGVFYARVFVVLQFPEGNIIPSNKEWVFELSKTKYGWQVLDFHLVNPSN